MKVERICWIEYIIIRKYIDISVGRVMVRWLNGFNVFYVYRFYIKYIENKIRIVRNFKEGLKIVYYL